MLALLANLLWPIGLLHPGISVAGAIGSFIYFVLKLSLGALFLAFIESTIVKTASRSTGRVKVLERNL